MRFSNLAHTTSFFIEYLFQIFAKFETRDVASFSKVRGMDAICLLNWPPATSSPKVVIMGSGRAIEKESCDTSIDSHCYRGMPK